MLVVRVPVMSAEQKAGLRAEIASSILDGLLLMEDGLNYKVVDLPLPRAWTPLLQEDVPEPEPPRPTGRNAAEKREILERLGGTGGSMGMGCFGALARACGQGVTETTLRNLYSGDEVQPIQVWRQVGAGLAKLGVSKSDTRKEGILMGNKNLRRLRCLVTAPTMCNLERLAQMEGSQSVGKVVDKLVREMISLHQPPGPWGAHYLTRFKRVT